MLWQILASCGIPDHLFSGIKKLYADITVNLRVGKAKGSFESTSGVKLGDPLVPVRFLCYAASCANHGSGMAGPETSVPR